jgi:putative ABC transport system ATP-binding protein
MLRFENVFKSYSRRDGVNVALEDVSLSLDRGRITGVFGPTRAGKSTLLRIAAGLESADSGTVTYKGEALGQMRASQLRRFRRREIGCVWAGQSWIDGLSALEHVALRLLIDDEHHRVADRVAQKLLDLCDVGQCAQADPKELSEGERRRVALARALVSEPRLLLADGLVSDLSSIEQEQIMLLLASLANESNLAVLITDTGAASMIRTDSVLFLREGKLLPDNLPNQGGRVYQLPTAPMSRSAADA